MSIGPLAFPLTTVIQLSGTMVHGEHMSFSRVRSPAAIRECASMSGRLLAHIHLERGGDGRVRRWPRSETGAWTEATSAQAGRVQSLRTGCGWGIGVDLAGECRMSAGVLPTGDLEAVCSLRNKRYIRDSSKSATGTREWSDPRCSSHT